MKLECEAKRGAGRLILVALAAALAVPASGADGLIGRYYSGYNVVNQEEQWFDWQDGYCQLGAGYHTIEITFFEAQSFSGIEVWWLRPSIGPSVVPYSGETFHTIPPTFKSGTLWEILAAPAVCTEAPYVNPRLSVRPLSDTVELAWAGFTNVTYPVESSTNLVTWQDRGGPLTGISGRMIQAVDVTIPCEYFRLRLE